MVLFAVPALLKSEFSIQVLILQCASIDTCFFFAYYKCNAQYRIGQVECCLTLILVAVLMVVVLSLQRLELCPSGCKVDTNRLELGYMSYVLV